MNNYRYNPARVPPEIPQGDAYQVRNNRGQRTIVLDHPGGGGQWNCTECEAVLNAPKLILGHLTQVHRIPSDKVTFRCSACNHYEHAKCTSVGTHMRYCRGATAQKQFPCQLCDLSFDTFQGKQVHLARTHREARNRELKPRKFALWTDRERRMMAENVLKLELEGKSNSEIDAILANSIMANRTVNSVRRQRRQREYLEQEQLVRLAATNHDGLMNPANGADPELPDSSSSEAEELRDEPNDENSAGIVDTRTKLEALVRRFERGDLSTTAHAQTLVEYYNGTLAWSEVKQRLFARDKFKRKPGRENVEAEVGARDTRAARKRREFKQTQTQWDKSRSSTVEGIINDRLVLNPDPTQFPELAKIEETYQARLGTPSEDVTSEPVQNEPQQVNNEAYGFISTVLIKECLGTFKADTASGSDHVSVTTVRKIAPEALCVILNTWRVKGVPVEEKENYSILLHKSGDQTDVGNYRPLTIGTVLARLYSKVWDRKLRMVIKLSARQKAFVPLDGCYQNVKIIQQAIKSHRKNKAEFNLVFLDLAKAFDTVSHESIRKALLRKGVPNEVVTHLMESLYSGATTQFRTQNGKTTRITIRCGVKQGDPLSPLLFNVVLDELLDKIERAETGVIVNDARLGALAFADDLAILAPSCAEMAIALNLCKEYFEERSLKVNANKCASLRFQRASRSKAVKVFEEGGSKWGNEIIPPVGFSSLPKYLGVRINPCGDVEIPTEDWENWFHRLKRAKLRVDQKVLAVKSILSAKIFFVLRLSNASITTLKKIDVMLRQWYRVLLHLPVFTPTAWIHSPKGGGLTCMTESVVLVRKKGIDKMVADPSDVVARGVALDLDVQASTDIRKLGYYGDLKQFRSTMAKRRTEQLKSVRNGTALVVMRGSHVKREWMFNGKKNLAGTNKVNLVKILSGTLPTRVNTSRGRNNPQEKLCRRCKTAIESDIHVLNECPKNKGMIIERHDRICKKIAKEVKLSSPASIVQMERPYVVGQRSYKPDVSIRNGDTLTFVDVTCAYEFNDQVLVNREVEKEVKYSVLNHENLAIEGVRHYEAIGLAIGSGGTIEKRTVEKLAKIGFPRAKVQHIQMIAMNGSSCIWRYHERHRR